MGSRPARAAFRRPSGFSLVEPPGRIAPAGGPPALSLPCKGPPQHTRTVPGSRRTHTANDASFPGLSRSSTHTGTVDPLSCGASGPARAAYEVWLPPSRRPPPSLRAPCGSRASSSFALPGLLLASIGLPLGRPCPHDVAHVDSPRSPGEQGGRRRLQGLDPDVELVRGAPCGTPRRSLPGLHPSRALSPPVLARAL
jgi:hypothetical protein